MTDEQLKELCGRLDWHLSKMDGPSHCRMSISTATEAKSAIEALMEQRSCMMRERDELKRDFNMLFDASSHMHGYNPETHIAVPITSLKWWRELVDLNPADLAPRLDAVLAAYDNKEEKE